MNTNKHEKIWKGRRLCDQVMNKIRVYSCSFVLNLSQSVDQFLKIVRRRDFKNHRAAFIGCEISADERAAPDARI